MSEDRRNPDFLKAVFRDVIREEVPAMLDAQAERLGIDPSRPLDFQKDMAWVRSARKTTDAIKSKSILTLVTALFAAVAAFFGFHQGS